MTIQIVVADSDALSRQWIKKNVYPEQGFEIVGECAETPLIQAAIRNRKPDLLIVDPDMPGWQHALLPRADDGAPAPAVIFFSQSQRHAVAAFEVGAVDFLLKPANPDRLSEALEHFRLTLQSARPRETESELIALLRNVHRYPEWFLIRLEGRSRFVAAKDIDWIESKRNNVLLHVGKTSYLYHTTTRDIELKLDPCRFLRIHRSTIVNIERVEELRPWLGGDYRITLKDGTCLPVSNGYRQKLKLFRRGAA
ncbi:MAG TPA: LytTR family DNA-binding domain-containing protein [Thermoanaerobaculia bacterium]